MWRPHFLPPAKAPPPSSPRAPRPVSRVGALCPPACAFRRAPVRLGVGGCGRGLRMRCSWSPCGSAPLRSGATVGVGRSGATRRFGAALRSGLLSPGTTALERKALRAEDGIRTHDPHLGKVRDLVHEVLAGPVACGFRHPVSTSSTASCPVVERPTIAGDPTIDSGVSRYSCSPCRYRRCSPSLSEPSLRCSRPGADQ